MHFTGFAFLKTYQKEKNEKKKSLISIGLPFNCPPFQADNLSPLAQLRAADPTQNLFPTGWSAFLNVILSWELIFLHNIFPVFYCLRFSKKINITIF